MPYWATATIHHLPPPPMTIGRGMHSDVRMALNVGQIVGAFDVLRETVVIRRETHEGLFLLHLPLVGTGLIQRSILQITI